MFFFKAHAFLSIALIPIIPSLFVSSRPLPAIFFKGNEISIPDPSMDTNTISILAREDSQTDNVDTPDISGVEESQSGRGGLINDLLFAEDNSVAKSDTELESRQIITPTPTPGPGPVIPYGNGGLLNDLLPAVSELLKALGLKKRQIVENNDAAASDIVAMSSDVSDGPDLNKEIMTNQMSKRQPQFPPEYNQGLVQALIPLLNGILEGLDL